MASIDEMLARAALPAWRERTAAMRAEFEARTGELSLTGAARAMRDAAKPQHEVTVPTARSPRAEGAARAMRDAAKPQHELAAGFFEARSAAFWDDALTRGAFGRELSSELGPDARAAVEPLARAHRGIFRVEPDGDRFLLVDEWSGAELSARPTTNGLRDALVSAAGETPSLVDGRVVGLPEQGSIELLPGALFHAADAIGPIRSLLPEARAQKLTTHELCDALLRMDHALRSLSRVKAAFAYRKEALTVRKAEQKT